MSVIHKPLLGKFETTNRCTGHCIYCRNRFRPQPTCDMEFDLYKHLVDKTDSLIEVQPFNFGEPLLYPYIVEAVRFASKRGHTVKIYTNARYLDPRTSGYLLEAGLDEIVFSVDAADPKTYQKIKPGLDFQTVLENIAQFAGINHTMGDHCFTAARATILPQNLHNLGQIEVFWRRYVRHFYKVPVIHYPSYHWLKTHMWSSKQPIQCPIVKEHITVKANGDLALCRSDWYGVYTFGSMAFHEDPVKAFNSDLFNQVRENMEKGQNYPALCDLCTENHWR